MARRLIIGDIHGRFSGLKAVLEKCAFNPQEDSLYAVGDLADRGEEPVETLRFLMGLPSFRPVLGNHDLWLEDWLATDVPDPLWVGGNGGDRTMADFKRKGVTREEKERLLSWLAAFPLVRIEDDAIIVHAGIPEGCTFAQLEMIANGKRRVPLLASITELEDALVWDRSYLESAQGALSYPLPPFDTDKTIFIGHTQQWKTGVPYINRDYHLVALDTGAGSGRGPITVYDMDSGEYWSAPV